MSALGYKRTLNLIRAMSASLPKADISLNAWKPWRRPYLAERSNSHDYRHNFVSEFAEGFGKITALSAVAFTLPDNSNFGQ
jgi:hypothetical protein